MKNTVKKIGLVMALTMVISASILPQISYAGKATKSQTKKTSITTSKNAKGNKTKKEKKKKKILVTQLSQQKSTNKSCINEA